MSGTEKLNNNDNAGTGEENSLFQLRPPKEQWYVQKLLVLSS